MGLQQPGNRLERARVLPYLHARLLHRLAGVVTLSCRVCINAWQQCCIKLLFIAAVVHKRVAHVGRMEVGVNEAMTRDQMDVLLKSRLPSALAVEDCVVQNAAAVLTQDLLCADEDAHGSVLEDVCDLFSAALN